MGGGSPEFEWMGRAGGRELQMVLTDHALPPAVLLRRFDCGTPQLLTADRPMARSNEHGAGPTSEQGWAPGGNDAVQIEAGEAMQIEMQALVSDRVIRDPSDTHLPATAWPRQMLAAFTARPPRAKGGLRVRTAPSSNSGAVPGHKWWKRLGFRVPTYESGVRGRPPRARR